MRKLATIRKISDLLPIEGADLILTAVIDGWTVVVKKNEFQIGDLCVYCEIDSFLPDGNPAWQHLVEKSSRTFEGGKGHRLRTVKLRGQLSQGFAAPIPRDLEIEWSHTFLNFEGARSLQEGDDVTNILNIKKWEAPIPAELAGQVAGNFPTFIKKTDQERCQNIGHEIFTENAGMYFEVTMKLDGSSFTAFYNNDDDGVCSRNWQLKIEENEHNTLVRMYVDSGLQAALRELKLNYAVQGELMGPGIQGNREGFTQHKLFVFDIYDIDNGCYLSPIKRRILLDDLHHAGLNKDIVEHVPFVAYSAELYDTLGITNVAGLLRFAEGKSINHAVREGLVFKRMDGKFSFKAISNLFLLKEKD
jgi:RNA ligase (TIGR02306 family)